MKLASAGAVAVPGNQSSHTANTMIKTIPETNSGMTVADSPPTVIIRSVSLPLRSAAMIPPNTPSGTTITKATTASLAEFRRALPRSSETGRENEIESPKSP